jgi:hypothetical protein
LARFLRRQERKVIEVSRPPRKGKRRLSGKSDTIDAEHAAREVLSGNVTTTPELDDGIVEAIRLVKIARDSAVKAHSQAMITLKATLVTAGDELRCELESLTDFKLVQACATLDPNGNFATRRSRCATCSLRSLAGGSSCTKRPRSTPRT